MSLICFPTYPPVALAWGLSASVAAISYGHYPVWSSILMP